MNNSALKYIVVFIIGGVIGYLSSFSAERNIAHPLPQNIKSSEQKNNTLVANHNKKNSISSNINDDKINELTCDDKSSQLITQLAVTEQKNSQIKDAMLKKISEAQQENTILKFRLAKLEPSNVSDDDIAKFVPKPHAQLVTNLPSNLKQEIYDLHQQQEDLDWGYKKQQQLTDFISTHVNSEFIKITSITCKINQCEVIIDELINEESLTKQGLTREEIQIIKDTQQPKYKQIFDELRLNPELNVIPSVYFPNRFTIYMILKDKAAKD